MQTGSEFQEDSAVTKKTLVYVGGLDERVDESTIQNLFIPFGDIATIVIPRTDSAPAAATPNAPPRAHAIAAAAASGPHRGFAFVEFLEADDAQAAIDNLHDSELYGRVLTCNLANPRRAAGFAAPGSGGSGGNGGSVFAEAESWAARTLPQSGADVEAGMRHARVQGGGAMEDD